MCAGPLSLRCGNPPVVGLALGSHDVEIIDTLF